jgi:hypothetical protein
LDQADLPMQTLSQPQTPGPQNPPQAHGGQAGPAAPFLARPAQVLFRDFVPGGTYSATLSLTNRGAAKNSFRLGELGARLDKVGGPGSGYCWGRGAAMVPPACRCVCLLAGMRQAWPGLLGSCAYPTALPQTPPQTAPSPPLPAGAQAGAGPARLPGARHERGRARHLHAAGGWGLGVGFRWGRAGGRVVMVPGQRAGGRPAPGHAPPSPAPPAQPCHQALD